MAIDDVSTEIDREQIRLALCSTRGRYVAERASQLSGVPRTTVYFWARLGLLVPDHHALFPKHWSYRDLVLLRMFAWLRGRGMSPSLASKRAEMVRHRLNAGEVPADGLVRSDGNVFLLGSANVDEITGEQLFESLVGWVAPFDLMMPVLDGTARPVHWIGPNLVRPSPHTAISPWVLSGEPCVQRTRIASASLFTLRTERGLSDGEIIRLYPDIEEEDVHDAIALEDRLRRHALAA